MHINTFTRKEQSKFIYQNYTISISSDDWTSVEGYPIMLQDLKDFLQIFAWKEFWIAVGSASLVVGGWVFTCFALMIPNTAIRSVTLWGFIFLLSILGGLVERSRKKRK